MKNIFLISTGGSGGHVIPATILYEHLSKQKKVILTTDKRGLKFLDKKNYSFEVIDTPKLDNIIFLPVNLIKIIFLIFRSYSLLRKKKIEKIFSTGGYMSLPIILAAYLIKLKIYLVEPNLVLGRANKFYLNFCTKIFCYSDKVRNFPNNFRDKIVSINPLVKEEFYNLKAINRVKEKFTLLVVGGSQGANIFDNNLKNTIINISKKKPIRIIQQTNQQNVSNLTNFYLKNNIENKIFTFNNNFHDLIQQSDLCITRAGASVLAELSVANVPFIAVPLPTSKDHHQLENANFYGINDCCWVVEQNYFEEKIEGILIDILINKKDFFKKKENLKKLNYQNTWYNVNQSIMKVLDED